MSYPQTISGFHPDTAVRPLEIGCTCRSMDSATGIVRRIHAIDPEVQVLRVSPDCPHHAEPWPGCEPPTLVERLLATRDLHLRMRHHHLRYRRKWAKR